MSERFPGMPPAKPPAPLQLAGAILLYGQMPFGRPMVCWLQDNVQAGPQGAYYQLPGAPVAAADRGIPVIGAHDDEAAMRSAAVRGLFEQTGLLLGEGARALSQARRVELRGALKLGALSWRELLKEAGVKLRAEDLRSAGRWLSPGFLPERFDLSIYLVESELSVLQVEAGSGWVSSVDALALWQRGAALLLPHTLHALKVMAQFTHASEARAQLATPPFCPGFIPTRFEYQEGVRAFPLETATLPPASHTNAFVLGNDELLVVDPGASDVRQYSKLLAQLASLKNEGKRPKAVFLTHHHLDHCGGARAVKDRLAIPLWCHAKTAEKLDFTVDRTLADGEVIRLEGQPPQHWQVLHTPGHAQGHLCLVEGRSRAAIVGDMVASLGSIVIDPPEGDMAEYLRQLQRLKSLPVGTLYPAHGQPVPNGPGKLAEYLTHRAAREARLLEVLGTGASTLAELVAKAYVDTPRFMHPVAERSALAMLEKLMAEKKVSEASGRYALA